MLKSNYSEDLKKYFVGCVINELSIGVSNIPYEVLSNPVVATGILANENSNNGVWNLKNFFRIKNRVDSNNKTK